MSQNIVYKTFELNTDIEHKAKPINLSGATTIKLTELPTGVKCWISTESNGTNLFPLVNRGDGWVNMPNPLYNLYIYTEGTTLDNQKILLNFTGQNDFFAYGNNSSERIDKVGSVESFSYNSKFDLYDVNTKLFDTSAIKCLIYKNGAFHSKVTQLPQITTRYFNRIFLSKILDLKQLTFEATSAYKIIIEGHADVGGDLQTEYDGIETREWRAAEGRDSLHIDLIDLSSVDFDNNFVELTNKGDYIDNLWLGKDELTIEKNDNFFTFWGMKYFRRYGSSSSNNSLMNSSYVYAPGNINFNIEYTSMGFLFKKMDTIIISLKSYRGANVRDYEPDVGFHFSLKIQIEKMQLRAGAPVIQSNPYINNDI